MYIGSTNINKIYNNINEITKIYQGSTLIYSGGTTPENPVWSGLTNYFRLDESGGTTAYDSKGSITGLTSGSAFWDTGKNNNCIHLSANTAMVDFGNVWSYERTQAFSISVWYKRNNPTSGLDFIFCKGVAGTVRGYLCYVTNGQMQFWLQNSSTNYAEIYTATNYLNTTNWYHLVFTYNGNSSSTGMKIYTNGSLTTTNRSGSLSQTIITTQPFRLGNRNDNYSAQGKMDEFGMWNRELTSTEVTTLYNSGNGLFY